MEGSQKAIEEADALQAAAEIMLNQSKSMRDNALALQKGLWQATAVQQAILRYKERRFRSQLLGDPHIALGPAWDILLDLFIQSENSRGVSVSSASIAAACPPTTALRWIQVLEEAQLVCRSPDKADSRRTFVSLTSKGKRSVSSILNRYISVIIAD